MTISADLVPRLVALFSIMLTSFAGVSMPALVHRVSSGWWPAYADDPPLTDEEVATRRRRDAEQAGKRGGIGYMHVVKLIAATGTGVVIATGLIHIVPDAQEDLKDAWGDSYPFAIAIATGTIMLLYIVESELATQLRDRQAAIARDLELVDDGDDNVEDPATHQPDRGGDGAPVVAASDRVDEPFLPPSEHGSHADATATDAVRRANNDSFLGVKTNALPAERPRTLSRRAARAARKAFDADAARLLKNSVATHVLEIGVAVHSVIIGFTMGMMTDAKQAWTLTIVMWFHQFCEGGAIGSAVMESRLPRKHSYLLWAIFTLTTPLGLALGIATEQAAGTAEDGSARKHRMHVAQGVLGAVAAGILLYMGLVDMLPNLFTMPPVPHKAPTTDDAVFVGSASKRGTPRDSSVVANYGTLTQPTSPNPLAAAPESRPRGGEELSPELAAMKGEGPTVSGAFRASIYVCLVLGATIMGVIGIWA